MHEGTTLKIAALTNDKIITTTSAERYKLGPLPSAHYDGRHADPKETDILVAAKNSAPGAPILVYVYKGCDCQFLIYPESN